MTDQQVFSAKLRGQKVLVIGGTSGIGYAVAEGAIEGGAHVILSSSSENRLHEAATSLKRSYPSAKDRVLTQKCSLADEKRLEEEISNLFKQTGEVDHIVFTAGNSVPPVPLEHATIEHVHQDAVVRYMGALVVAKHALAHLAPRGSLTLTTGIVTERPIPGWSAIAGARSAVLGLGKALALDLRPRRVNVVSVGAVDTPTWDGMEPEARQKTMEALVSKTTTGRIAEARDVAEAYLYCMKDLNVTGSVISTNGGALLI